MKILVVLPRFPYPLEKGDKLRAFYQIKELSALGHEISLFCITHEAVKANDVAQVRPYCRDIHIVRLRKAGSGCRAVRSFCSVHSLQTAFWCSPKAKRAFRRMEQHVQPDVIYNQMVRTMPLVLESTRAKVMDFQDCLSLNMLRNMQKYELSLPTDNNPTCSSRKSGKQRYYYRHRPSVRYFVYHYEFKMLRRMEVEAFNRFNALTIISEPDRMALPCKENEQVHIVPNGVDFDYFRPQEVEKQYDVAFCGNMQYSPNVQTAKYLVQQVMPLVWQQKPQARVLLAGATPGAAVRALADDPRVVVSGTVPDIRHCYAAAKVFAAPMQAGSGLQNKLLEAMAMEIPCVTSSLANAALGATPGQEILVGDTPQEVAQHILLLLNSRQQSDIQADNARHFVRTHFSWQAATQKLATILQQAADSKNRG
jgi:glycosyltransferase involved in cell wall biosynthesis